jgi:hypothetical protein
MLAVTPMLGDMSESMKRPMSDVQCRRRNFPTSQQSLKIVDTGADAKPSDRPKSLQRPSKILKSKHCVICNGTNVLTMPSATVWLAIRHGTLTQ